MRRIFIDIPKVLKILATFPVSSCESEIRICILQLLAKALPRIGNAYMEEWFYWLSCILTEQLVYEYVPVTSFLHLRKGGPETLPNVLYEEEGE